MIILIFFIILYHTVVVRCENASATATTTLNKELILTKTLTYNKSGNIHALSWSKRSRIPTNPSPPTSELNHSIIQYQYQLVAASVSTIQVWNITITKIRQTNSSSSTFRNETTNDEIQYNLTNLINQSETDNNTNGTTASIIRALSFSSNGKWLASGGNSGVVHIWSCETNPWTLIQTLPTSTDGKIRSLSWHSNNTYVAAAGIQFRFMIWDTTSSWRPVVVDSRPSDLPPPPNDSYVHYVDWNPITMGRKRNEIVVDTTIYELTRYNNSNNLFNSTLNNTTPRMVVRPVFDLTACQLCTMPQWSPDGQYIATGFGSHISISQRNAFTSNSSITVNNYTTLNNWTLIYNLSTVTETYMTINAIAWSPDGKYLAVGGAGNTSLFLYSTNNFTEPPLVTPTSTGYGIDAIAWRPDGQQIAISTAKVIEIRTIHYHEPLVPIPPIISMIPSPTNSPVQDYTNVPISYKLESNISIAGMAGIGIIVVVTSFVCVGIIFYRRRRYISSNVLTKHRSSQSKRGVGNSLIIPVKDGDKTSSDDDPETDVYMNRIIMVPTSSSADTDIVSVQKKNPSG